MTTAFLLSGFGLNKTAADTGYLPLRQMIGSKGYKVVPVKITWNHKTTPRYCEEFVEFYKKHKSKDNIVIGNSFGAMVAFITAPALKPERVYLCSLSPFFKEDLESYKVIDAAQRFGTRRIKEFKKISAQQIEKQINETNTSVTLLYGEKEKERHSFLVKRVKSTAKNLKNSKLVEVPLAAHALRETEYILGLEREL